MLQVSKIFVSLHKQSNQKNMKETEKKLFADFANFVKKKTKSVLEEHMETMVSDGNYDEGTVTYNSEYCDEYNIMIDDIDLGISCEITMSAPYTEDTYGVPGSPVFFEPDTDRLDVDFKIINITAVGENGYGDYMNLSNEFINGINDIAQTEVEEYIK